jgi:hypothetical protein
LILKKGVRSILFDDLPHNPHVHLYSPAANEDRRLIAVARLTAQPEPPNLSRLQHLIQQRHGMLDLLDIFVEAYRLIEFTRFLTHSGTKEVRSREVLRPLLLLDLLLSKRLLLIVRIFRVGEGGKNNKAKETNEDEKEVSRSCMAQPATGHDLAL